MVHDLKEMVRYNNVVAQVIGCHKNKIIVQIPESLGGTLLVVNPRNVKPLPKGTIVEFHGLSNTDLNGEIGNVDDLVAGSDGCRYNVRMRDGAVKSVKGTKLIARIGLWDIIASNVGHAWPQWRSEQNCLFIDNAGHHRRFNLHLPSNFTTSQKDAKRTIQPWPLMLYLHGTGGTSFLTHSKKTLKSLGLQYAATKFVLVSPNCDWKWREQPKEWVTELVMALRAAEWVDHRRIYITGCSMGGMSTWEVGAARPDIYAAIAPVAGHHKAERESLIANQLRTTPIFVVHSSHDDTCPIRGEEHLWEKVKAAGNKKMQISLSTTIDHCSMYERTYCDDTTLFEWLLQFKRVDF